MLKCNTSAVVVVAEKMWISQTRCDNLLAAACQDCSAWNERKKTPTVLSAGPKYGLRFVKKLCTRVLVLGVVVMGKDEGHGCNVSYCWQDLLLFWSLLNSKSPFICIVGKQQKHHKARSLNYCFFANQRVLFFVMPFLPYKGFALTGHLKTAKCEYLWSSTHFQVRIFAKQG